ncbi:MAG: AraC family transcriptional regulator [Kiritimatiellae bacterium]|nr:AraC family transcriptional regulator [Kiritimatiellia bacterium]
MKNYYIKYLPLSPTDRAWGLHVTAVGQSRVAAHEHYPPGPHPERYSYEWPAARVLQEFQCIYIVRGEGLFESEATGRMKVKAGNLCVLLPDAWHRYRPNPKTGWDEYWVSFDGDMPRRLMEQGILSPKQAVYDVGLDESILRCYKDLIDVIEADRIGGRQIGATLTAQLIARARAATRVDDDPAHKMLRDAVFFIEQNVNQPINFQQFAKTVNVGYSSFRHEFKRHIGLSPKQYHLELRISKAKSLLTNTTLTVKEIADSLNFDTPYYFMKLFKKRVEMSPTQWRRYSRGGDK